MFARALELAAHYTHPFVVSARLYDGRVQCAAGAFVVLNEDGWILTAAHLLEPATLHAGHQAEIALHEARAQEIAGGRGRRRGRRSASARSARTSTGSGTTPSGRAGTAGP